MARPSLDLSQIWFCSDSPEVNKVIHRRRRIWGDSAVIYTLSFHRLPSSTVLFIHKMWVAFLHCMLTLLKTILINFKWSFFSPRNVVQYFSEQHCTTWSLTTPLCIQFMEMKQLNTKAIYLWIHANYRLADEAIRYTVNLYEKNAWELFISSDVDCYSITLHV